MGAAAGSVDSWIIGPTAYLSFFIGIVPPISAGFARIAKVKSAKVDDGKWSEGAKLWARENEAFLILGGFFVVFLVRKGWENARAAN